MTRWQRGEAEIERMLADGQLQVLTGAAADGGQWLAKARRTLSTAAGVAVPDPDSAFTLAYDAARFACTALLAQQGLRATTRGGHYAVELAVRGQFGVQLSEVGQRLQKRLMLSRDTVFNRDSLQMFLKGYGGAQGSRIHLAENFKE